MSQMKRLLCLLLTATTLVGLLVPSAWAEDDTAKSPEATVAPPPRAEKKPDFSGLTADEVRIYQSGEIGTGSRIGGGLLGTVIGLGTGHIVYGEYGRKGWIFTLGEVGSYGIMVAGAVSTVTGCLTGSSSSCSNGAGLMVAGAVAFVGFRIWEIIDVWTLPGSHNSKYRAIKTKVDGNDSGERDSPRLKVVPFAGPGTGASVNAGLAFAYRF